MAAFLTVWLGYGSAAAQPEATTDAAATQPGPKANTQEQTQEQARALITVGVENINHLPFYGLCGGDYCGFGRDVIDAFAADKGLGVRYLALPIPRLHRTLADGGVDLKFPANPLWAHHLKEGATIRYSAPVVDFVDGFIMLAGREDLPRTVSTLRGFTIDLSTIGPDTPYLMEANAEENLFDLLLRGRIDAVYTNVGVMRHFLRRTGQGTATVSFRRDMPYNRSHYLLSTASRPNLIEDFDAWMANNRDTLDRLKATWQLDFSEESGAPASTPETVDQQISSQQP